MINKIKSFFERELSLGDTQNSAEDIDAKLQQACAVLLLEISKADYQQTQDELEKVSKLLQKEFSLSDDKLKQLIELSHEAGKDVTSMYPLTALINEHYEYSAKVTLLKFMWKVAFADGELSMYEDHLIRKIADLLYVSHSDFIKTKLSEAQ